jgi:hypothetical protein
MLPERAFRVNFLATLIGVALGFLGCRTGLSNGVFSKQGVRYGVGAPPPGFRKVGFADNDVAFERMPSGHSIAINSTCQGLDDAPLEVLRRHLLTGFTAVDMLEESTVPLDGRDSLRSHVRAELDGVPVEMMLVVLKKNGCVFDFTYLSPPAGFSAQLSTFDRLLSQFHLIEPAT